MKVIEKIKAYFAKLFKKEQPHRSLKHVCRACHQILDEDEMSHDDISICKECAKRE